MSGIPNDVIHALSNTLVEWAKRAGEERGLYGASAGELLRRAKHDFNPRDFGVDSVREFIGKFVPELHVIRKSGSDVVYGLKDWPARDSVSRNSQADPDAAQLWRTWVSPSSPSSIVFTKDGSSVRTTHDRPPESDEVEVRPADQELHRSIARKFLESQGEKIEGSARASLGKILADVTDPSWWPLWTRTIRRESWELNRAWLEYRQSSLETALKEQLEKLELHPDAVGKIMAQVITAREHHQRQRAAAFETARPAISPASFFYTARPSRVLASNLVRELASRMTERDLRDLCLLLAQVFDTITDAQRR